jgi:hypothetical protein
MKHQKIVNNWRNFLITEAEALPSSKAVEIDNALWPVARPEAAASTALTSDQVRQARAAMGGGKEKEYPGTTKEIFSLHRSIEERSPLSINASLNIVATDEKAMCTEQGRASAVLLSFDVLGRLPGHNTGQEMGFQTDKDFDSFLGLINKAARTTQKNALLGSVNCFYPRFDHGNRKAGYKIVKDSAKVSVGVSPIWNQFTNSEEPAVVIIFGTMGEHEGGGGPYFLHVDEALLMAREYARLAAPYIKRNDGSVYQYPSAIPPGDYLLRMCDYERNKKPIPQRTQGKAAVTIPGLGVKI